MPRSDETPDASGDRDSAGRFLPSNRFWEPASKLAGRKPIFEHPEDLRAACVRYFEWNDTSPLYRDELVTFQGAATHEPIPLARVLTIAGLCINIGIGLSTWKLWRQDRQELKDVIEWAEMVIAEHQMQMGFSGQANPAIVSRVLGLADKSELSGPGGGPIETQEVSARVILTERLARLAARNGENGGTGEPV